MSIAGKRSGLEGSRSNLFFQAIRIIKEMRCATDGKYPRFAVWENVPGCQSSNGGEDFRRVLEEFCRIKDESVSVPKPAKWTKAGYIMGSDYSVAWRLLDSQYFGVAQRRRRLFAVADFRGRCATKVLFESESVSGYSPQSFHSWQRAAEGSENGSGRTGTVCMCDQGGERIDILTDKTSTLRAEAHHPPCVMESAGFCTEHSAKARGIGYEEETSPTLRAGVVPAMLKIRCGHGNGGRGALVQENKSATLACNNDQTLFVPKAYGICSKHSNAMMSDNPNSGFYEAETSRTIDTSNQSPCKNQGGMIVIEGNGSRPSHHGDGYKESDTMYTLNCTENHAVSYGIGRPAMNQGYNARFSFQIEKEKSPTLVASGAGGIAHPVFSSSKASFFTNAKKEKANTLVASDYKDPPLVNDSTPEVEYIVRRLTPQECALLQGMPMWWCDGLETENPTDEEIDWWYDVFETHRKAIGKSSKPKSRKQVEKWLKNPYSDSAAYKMWGNGIYIGNAWFVLAGIAYYANAGANCEQTDTMLSSEFI